MLLIAALAFCLNSLSAAETPKTPPAEKGADGTTATPPAPNADLYKIPENGNADALVKFCKGILEYKPTSEEDAQAHVKRAMPSLQEALAKILTLEKDETSDNAHFALQITVMVGMNTLMSGPTAPGFDKTLKDIDRLAGSTKLDGEDAGLLMQAGKRYSTGDAGQSAGVL